MQRKMQFTANIAAAAIQNISQQKSGEAITQTDLINIMRLSFLTVYPGNTLIPTSTKHGQLGYLPHIFLHYVQGKGTNQANIKWAFGASYDDTPPVIAVKSSQFSRSVVRYVSGASSNIYPMLTINSGEAKIIYECCLYYPFTENGYFFSPNNPRYPNKSLKEVPPRDAFGFLFLNPKHHDQANNSNFFDGVTVFTPINNSAFSTTAPQ